MSTNRKLIFNRVPVPNLIRKLGYGTITALLFAFDIVLGLMVCVVASRLPWGAPLVWPEDLSWSFPFEMAAAVMTPLLLYVGIHCALSSTQKESVKALTIAEAHLRSGGCLKGLEEPPAVISARLNFAVRANALVLCALILHFLASVLFLLDQFTHTSGLFS